MLQIHDSHKNSDLSQPLYTPINFELTEIIKPEKAILVNNTRMVVEKGTVRHVTRNLHWKSDLREPITRGINNLSNTCYLNSVMQILLNTPCIYYGVQQGLNNSEEKGKGKVNLNNVLTELVSICRAKTMTPSYLVNNIFKLDKRFVRGRQQDSHEFFLLFLNNISKELSDSFKGKMLSQVVCNKGHISETQEEFFNLTLSIQRSGNLKNSLKNYFQPSNPIKGYFCKNCRKETVIRKSYVPKTNPSILVLHLTRFDRLGRKVKSYLPFDFEMQFNGDEYSLYGTVEHLGGNINFGHYIAFVHGANKIWYRVS